MLVWLRGELAARCHILSPCDLNSDKVAFEDEWIRLFGAPKW